MAKAHYDLSWVGHSPNLTSNFHKPFEKKAIKSGRQLWQLYIGFV
jgi:hypothetical protein